MNAPSNRPDVLAAARYDDLAVPLGSGSAGPDELWLPKRDPHILVAGPVGSGKTVFAQRLLREVNAAGWESWVAGAGMSSEYSNAVADRLVLSTDAVRAVIKDAHALMTERYQRRRKIPLALYRPLLIVLEEPSRIRDDVDTVDALGGLLSLGRSARIHLLITTTQPETGLLTGAAGDSLALRIGLGQLSPLASRSVFGDRVTGTEGDRGAGHIIGSDGRIRAIRVPGPTVSREGVAS